jgi:hypothetical protein
VKLPQLLVTSNTNTNTMDQFDDDDYVASLLKNEAKANPNNYLIRGLQGFLPSR